MALGRRNGLIRRFLRGAAQYRPSFLESGKVMIYDQFAQSDVHVYHFSSLSPERPGCPNQQLEVIGDMSIGRLYRGVVRVVTEEGPYYLKPQLRQRLRLIWMFRNFNELPAVVLKPAELQIITELAQSCYSPRMELNDELIGTLDYRAMIKKSVQSETSTQLPRRTA